MNGNLFKKEFKRNVFSLILWMIIITVLITVTMAVYRTFAANQSKVMDMISLVPKGLIQFKGVSSFGDLFSVLGFYAANNVIYVMVLGSIYAIVLSSNILLKEEYNKTAEYLLTFPLTRSEIFLSKSAVLIINILLLNLVTSMAGLLCLELVKNDAFNIKPFLILTLYTLLLHILFGATGLFLSTLVKRPRPVTTFCIALVLILYFINTLSRITESVEKLGYLSPFTYVNLDVNNPAYNLEFLNLIYFAGISLLLAVMSFRLYSRRDILT